VEILAIEDDPGIGKALRKAISEAGHSCTWAKDGTHGLELAQTQKYDALILDLLLPGESGWQVLEQIRCQGIRTPVIVVTALGSLEDRVAALNAGADDYLVKPFALVELMARVEAVCRRTQHRPPAVLQAGSLTLDLGNRRVASGGVEITLTPTEFSLLELLMRYSGQVVTRKMLCEHIWESDWEGITNVIDVHVNRLRNKLQQVRQDDMIATVRGRGFALRAPVKESFASSESA
jgi:two-component system OmpR family response regulator/two-component system copper resistance phosphate regulon response regulator CusR